MNKQSIKLKISTFVIAVIAILTACVLLFRSSPVKAEGNNAGNGEDNQIEIRMDVNGEDARNNAGGGDNSVDKISTNNGLHFKVRHILVGPVIEKIDPGNSSSYIFAENGIINGSKSFDVAIEDAGSSISITARSINLAGGHFSAKLRNVDTANYPDDIKIAYFRVASRIRSCKCAARRKLCMSVTNSTPRAPKKCLTVRKSIRLPTACTSR